MDKHSLLKEEQEMEARIFGTPSSAPASKEETTAQEEVVEVHKASAEQASSTVPPTDATEDWEKRYKGLRASRDERLHTTQMALAHAQSRIAALEEQIVKLKEDIQPREDKDIFAGILTDEDKEAIGETAIEAMRKTAQAAANARAKEFQEEIKNLREERKERAQARVEQEHEKAYSLFLERLSSIVPDYRTLNTDKGFLEYLSKEDIDGTARLANLQAAEARGDVTAVARYMLDYKKEGSKEGDKLAKLVTPEGSGATPPKEEKKSGSISMEEINAHYNRHSKGYYKGRHKEFLEMERKIDYAVSRGLVTKR